MRLFEVSLIQKVFDKGERNHSVDRRIVLADDAGQARERALEAESLPEAVIAVQVEDLGGAVVANAASTRMPSHEVRAILKSRKGTGGGRAHDGWTVLSDELAMPGRPAFTL